MRTMSFLTTAGLLLIMVSADCAAGNHMLLNAKRHARSAVIKVRCQVSSLQFAGG